MKLYLLSTYVRAAVLVGAVSSFVSCTNVLGIETTKFDESTGIAPSEDWSCVGKAAPDNSDTITIKLKVTGFLTDKANPVKAEVRSCSWLLADCGSELPTSTDDHGSLDVQIKENRYLEFTSPGYKSLLWFFSRKPVKSFDMEVMLISEKDFEGMTAGIKAPADASKGYLTFSAYSCGTTNGNPTPAKGVVVNASPRNAESKRYYAVGQSFVIDTEKFDTTDLGRGAIFNLDPGNVSVTVTHPSRNTPVIQTAPLPIRANTISTIDLYPQ